jgi:hypothetical protein
VELHHLVERLVDHQPQAASLGHPILKAELAKGSRVMKVHLVVTRLEGS